MTTPTTTARRTAAESAYQLSPTTETLGALQLTGAAEMDEYLAGYDARHAADTYTTGTAPGTRPALARLLTAYNRYIDQETASTDGPLALLTFEDWKASRTTVLEPTPEYRTLPPIDRRVSAPRGKESKGNASTRSRANYKR
jgi:hypothetical protein